MVADQNGPERKKCPPSLTGIFTNC